MDAASGSVFELSQTMLTVLSFGLKLKFFTLKSAISISLIIHCTPSAKSLLAPTTLTFSEPSSFDSSAQTSSGTSIAFFLGPLPLVAAFWHCVSVLAMGPDHSWPASKWVSLSSARYSFADLYPASFRMAARVLITSSFAGNQLLWGYFWLKSLATVLLLDFVAALELFAL